jgi:hypothetical protein
MAVSSWNALYTVIEQKFMRKRQWRQLHLLKVFVQHADPFGLSFPGPDLISELTGIGTIKQINETLEWLVDGEYVKVWEHWNRYKRIWETEYQVSPLVMYIREDFQGYAEKVWMTGERDFDHEDVLIVIKRNGQPSSEPESEPTSVNQHQNQHHHPAKMLLERKTPEAPPVTTGKTARKRKTGISRSAEKENPQAGGPVPPEKIDLRRYHSPLPSGEDRAQDLKLMFNVRINQARALIANYDAGVIEAAARAVLDAMEKGTCKSPPALLTAIVKRGAISAEDKNLYPSRAEQIAAANADMNAYD